jgi:transcriptional regulator with XRE-family HTH domain
MRTNTKPTESASVWAAALRAERVARGLDQTQFAALLGFSHGSVISHYERGLWVPGPRTRARMDAVLRASQ